MAFVNPCENCKDPGALAFASSTVENALAQFAPRHSAAIEYAERAETPAPKKERLLGAVANAAAFMAECHIIGERANSVTCDPDTTVCGRLAFIVEASQVAASNVLADVERRSGDEPPQPPQT